MASHNIRTLTSSPVHNGAPFCRRPLRAGKPPTLLCWNSFRSKMGCLPLWRRRWGERTAVIKEYLSKHDMALDSTDLNICQHAFDAILLKLNIARNTEDAEKIAAMVIELYRQGVHDENQLVKLVGVK